MGSQARAITRLISAATGAELEPSGRRRLVVISRVCRRRVAYQTDHRVPRACYRASQEIHYRKLKNCRHVLIDRAPISSSLTNRPIARDIDPALAPHAFDLMESCLNCALAIFPALSKSFLGLLAANEQFE